MSDEEKKLRLYDSIYESQMLILGDVERNDDLNQQCFIIRDN